MLSICYRCLAAQGSSAAAAETEPKQTVHEKTLQEPKPSEHSGWFSRFLDRDDRSIDTGHEQHSSRLSDKDTVYEIQCKLQLKNC